MPPPPPSGIRADDLASRLGLELQGPGGHLLTGAAALENAGPADLSFVGNPKLFEAARLSRAGSLIAHPSYQPAPEQAIMVSDQPRAHFAQALGILYPPPETLPGVHPTALVAGSALVDPTAEIGPHAVIEPGAMIGPRARIGAGSCIGRGAAVGEDTILYGRVFLYERVTIGRRCVLHAGVVIGADGFGFELQGGRFRKVPQVGIVRVGDDVEIGANSCVDRATLGVTEIGDGTKIDNLVHIAHNCRIGKHVVIAAQTGMAGGVDVGDYAVIGGQVGIGDKARIESRAVIGSGAGILTSKIVRAGEPVWGTPARPLRQYLAQLATVSRLAIRGRQERERSVSE